MLDEELIEATTKKLINETVKAAITEGRSYLVGVAIDHDAEDYQWEAVAEDDEGDMKTSPCYRISATGDLTHLS